MQAVDVRVPVAVTILDDDTGELAVATTYVLMEHDDQNTPSLYIWSEGNFSCDCNRRLFFEEALGRPAPEHPDCGWSRFRVLSIVRHDTGARIYGPEVKRG